MNRVKMFSETTRGEVDLPDYKSLYPMHPVPGPLLPATPQIHAIPASPINSPSLSSSSSHHPSVSPLESTPRNPFQSPSSMASAFPATPWHNDGHFFNTPFSHTHALPLLIASPIRSKILASCWKCGRSAMREITKPGAPWQNWTSLSE